MIAWGLETLVASTLLMLLVLVLRGPVRRAVGPGLAYALWLLPVLRMLLPPLPAEWHESAAPVAAGHVLVEYVIEPLSAPAVDAVQAAAPKIAAVAVAPAGWFPWIFAAWALGALGFLAYHLVAHYRFCARLRRQSQLSHTIANGRVHVIETEAAQGPLAFGIWRKYVAFPKDFSERYDDVERDLALAHELGHHVRGDLIANWVALVVLAIHWFNPIAWRAFRAFRADQEMACDALVLAGRAKALRHAYGRAIVKSAHGGAVSAACHLHTINDVKGRLRMLTTTRRATRTQLFAGVAALGGLTLGALALTASGTEAAARIRGHVEKAVGVELADLAVLPEVPTPPVPPAPPLPPQVNKVPVPPSNAVPPAPPAPPSADARGSEPSLQVSEWTDKDGRHHVVRTIHRVRPAGDKAADKDRGPGDRHVHSRVYRFSGPDGDVMFKDGREMEMAFKDFPEVKNENCGTAGPGRHESVIHTKDGDKRKIVICTDRIELASKQAAEMGKMHAEFGKMHAEFAMHNALTSLRMARRSVENEQSLSESQRKEALDGIDHAMRELEKDADAKD